MTRSIRKAPRRKPAPARTVLVTGFEPFDGHEVNPSAQAAHALDQRTIAGRRVIARTLPVRLGDALRVLKRALDELRPALVVCVGEARGRAEIAVERVAINIMDARIPDNAGAQPIDRSIAPRGPAAYWSTLPIKAVVAALGKRGIPAVVSQTAGTFVCNYVFYGLMHELCRRRGARGGFIHVPSLPSMELDKTVEALEIAIVASLENRRDLRVGGGALH